MSDQNDKHIAVLRKAAAAVKDRGHDGDSRLADSVLGIVASLAARRAPAAAPIVQPVDDEQRVLAALTVIRECSPEQFDRAIAEAGYVAAPVGQAEPVAWMRTNGVDCTSAAGKRSMEKADFGYWPELVKEYSIPLYAAPTAAAADAKDAAYWRFVREQGWPHQSLHLGGDRHGQRYWYYGTGNDMADRHPSPEQAIRAAIATSADEVKS
jgi:hypothetical protein